MVEKCMSVQYLWNPLEVLDWLMVFKIWNPFILENTGCLKNRHHFHYFICHKYIDLINKYFPDFLCPNCYRFFSTSVYQNRLMFNWSEIHPGSNGCKLWIYQIIYIQRQNSVKSNTSNHVFFQFVVFWVPVFTPGHH